MQQHSLIGRYDTLLEDERHAQDLIPPSPLCAVGCSLSLDILAQFCCTNKSGNFDQGRIIAHNLLCINLLICNLKFLS